MINPRVLSQKRSLFGKLSRLLDYPEKRYMRKDFICHFTGEEELKTKELFTEFWRSIREKSFAELEMLYVETFDFNKKSPLYMTFYKFEDARERGQMLAKLKFLYEMFGLLAIDEELTDFLPLILEFYEAGDWCCDERFPDLEVLFGVIEDGTFHLLKELKKEAHPFQFLIKAVRYELKACTVRKGERQNVE